MVTTVSETIVWINAQWPIIDAVVHPLERDGYNLLRFDTLTDALTYRELSKASLVITEIAVNPAEESALGFIDELLIHYSGPVLILSVLDLNNSAYSSLLTALYDRGIRNYLIMPILPSRLRETAAGILRGHSNQ